MSSRDGIPTTVFLRPIGSPVALGLSGLVAASLVLSGLELGWIAGNQRGGAGLILVAFAFPLQFAAAMLAFVARDGAVGAAMGILAGTWVSTGLTYLSSAPGSRGGALGLLLLASCTVLALAAVAAATGKLAPALVFGLSALRLALSAVYQLGGSEFWQDVAGVVGLIVVVLAAYTMAAAALEDACGTTRLPLGRRGQADVEYEAGVRAQL